MTIAYKLSIEKHLRVKRQDRQRVHTAAQLLSNTTANALEYLHPNDVKMKTLAKFIRLTDSWFDLFNSYTVFDSKDARNAFGIKTEIQMAVIDQFKKAIGELQVGNRTEKLPWQQGILQSLNALPMLLENLKQYDSYEVLLHIREQNQFKI